MDMSMMGLWNSMGPMAKGVFILLCILSVYSSGRLRRALADVPEGQTAVGQVRARGRPAPEAGQAEGGHRPRQEVQAQPRREGRLGGLLEFAVRGARGLRPGSRHRRRGRARDRARLDDDDGRHEEGPRRPRDDRDDGAVHRPLRHASSASSTRSAAWRRPAPAVSASVSAGISEALVTTALGLFVAIPAVWLYNSSSTRSSASRWRCRTRLPSSSTTS